MPKPTAPKPVKVKTKRVLPVPILIIGILLSFTSFFLRLADLKYGFRLLEYPINYGYIPGEIGGDGEELDVYLLGVEEPVDEYVAKVIGIIHRQNDNEDKLVAAPEGMCFTRKQIKDAVDFQEKITIFTLKPNHQFCS